MEFAKAEVTAVELDKESQELSALVELQSLELALLGGGVGDVAF